MSEQGLNHCQIARLLGVSRDTVRYDLLGKRKMPYPMRKEHAISILRAALARLEAA